jgi:hypothetical protein
MNTKILIVCDHTGNLDPPQLYLEGGVEWALARIKFSFSCEKNLTICSRLK